MCCRVFVEDDARFDKVKIANVVYGLNTLTSENPKVALDVARVRAQNPILYRLAVPEPPGPVVRIPRAAGLTALVQGIHCTGSQAQAKERHVDSIWRLPSHLCGMCVVRPQSLVRYVCC